MRSDGAFHPSDFATWRGCDKRYQLEVIERQPARSRHPKAVNGTAIHYAIEWMHSPAGFGVGTLLQSDIEAAYVEAFDRAISSPRFPWEAGIPVAWGDFIDPDHARASFATDAVEMLRGYASDVRNQTANVVAMHKPWAAEIDGVPWAGEIDRLDLDPDGYTICDFKSGAKLSPIPMRMWHQIAYAVGLEAAEGIRAKRVRWIALPDYVPYQRSGKAKDGREYRKGDLRGPAYYDIEINRGVIDAMREEMRLFVAAVGTGRFPRRPSNYQCSLCGVSDVCLAGFSGSIAGIDPALVSHEGGEND